MATFGCVQHIEVSWRRLRHPPPCDLATVVHMSSLLGWFRSFPVLSLADGPHFWHLQHLGFLLRLRLLTLTASHIALSGQ